MTSSKKQNCKISLNIWYDHEKRHDNSNTYATLSNQKKIIILLKFDDVTVNDVIVSHLKSDTLFANFDKDLFNIGGGIGNSVFVHVTCHNNDVICGNLSDDFFSFGLKRSQLTRKLTYLHHFLWSSTTLKTK